ncbi:MAG: DUF177 domain-containing protein [Candidatus Omnitrophica bacterium]|nr:DUF177 domain-containing protein [Candidatus Omnitrophota bacterium]
MKININEIPPQGLELEEIESAQALDIERSDIEFTKDVLIKVRIKREYDSLRIHLDIESEISFSCARCLEDESKIFAQHIDIIKDAKEERIIDLTQIAREEIIFSYPDKLLCKEDCKGLCPQCGRNRNVHTCRCDAPLGSLGIHIDRLDN